jgi:heme/copper-type cytochrome/quinol oxidase subunit 2
MSATFAVNLFSLVVLFNHHILEQGAFWIAFFAIGLVIMTALDIIYNKKRRERIRQEYKRESRKSRRCGVFWVVGYEILSFAFLIWIFSLLAKFYSP